MEKEIRTVTVTTYAVQYMPHGYGRYTTRDTYRDLEQAMQALSSENKSLPRRIVKAVAVTQTETFLEFNPYQAVEA